VKRVFSCLLVLIVAATLASAADAAVKKKKKIVRKRKHHYRRIVRNWPKGGPRPVFPTAGHENYSVGDPPPPPPGPKPAVKVDPPARDYFFAEGGLANGGGALELGYGRQLNEKLALSGALGFTFFTNNNGVALDLIRAAYKINNVVFAGAGISYAHDMPGLELFAGRQFERWSVRAGYSGVLGLRLAAGYKF